MKTVLLICFLAWAQAASAAGGTVHITTGEFPPWTSKSLKYGGFTNHVISEAFKLEGYHADFKFYPWKRAFEAAKDGKEFQATSYWYPSDERKKFYLYSDPIQTDAVVFFHLKSNPMPHWKTLDDLKGERIGATAGFTYTAEFWKAAKSGRLDIEVANSDALNFKKLLKGRIDLFPDDPLVGQKVLRGEFSKAEADTVVYDQKPLVAPTGHLLISRKAANAEKLLAAFNRGLAKLRKSGRYEVFQKELIAGKYDQ